MTLTPEQRYTAYCIMLEEAEKRPIINSGLCWLMYLLFDIETGYRIQMVDVFPELHGIGVKRATGARFWFPQSKRGWQQRRAILREIITEMEKKLYQ